MSKSYGLLIDYDYCTGCHSCETACKMELGLTLKNALVAGKFLAYKEYSRRCKFPNVWEFA